MVGNGIGERRAPSTKLFNEDPNDVVRRRNPNAQRLGQFQPNGPSLQDDGIGGQATLTGPNLGQATAQGPQPGRPTNLGGLAGELAVSGGLGNATLSSQPRYQDPTHYRTPHIPGATENLGSAFR